MTAKEVWEMAEQEEAKRKVLRRKYDVGDDVSIELERVSIRARTLRDAAGQLEAQEILAACGVKEMEDLAKTMASAIRKLHKP